MAFMVSESSNGEEGTSVHPQDSGNSFISVFELY